LDDKSLDIEQDLGSSRFWQGKVAGFVRERFLSFGMELSMGFLLWVSLLLSAFLAAGGKFVSGVFRDRLSFQT
jgi:hypothetical protein